MLIGQAPSKLTDSKIGRRAFSGYSGLRLAMLAGLSHEEFLLRVEAVNLLRRFPGRDGEKGDLFPFNQAKLAASKLRGRLVGRTVILAGQKVAEAFDLGQMDWCEVREVGSTRFALIPHPSGVNLWYNKKRNRERVASLLRSLIFRREQSNGSH